MECGRARKRRAVATLIILEFKQKNMTKEVMPENGSEQEKKRDTLIT